MLPDAENLVVIIPAYNEEGAISMVLNDWLTTLKSLNINFSIHVYNDGSSDNTIEILKDYANGDSNIIIHDKKNSGHGPTILKGYRDNSDSTWIFQIDSDNEISSKEFTNFWNNRENFDFLIGMRSKRNAPLIRSIISLISRKVVWLFYGTGVWDVNCPYRLIRTSRFKSIFLKIPDNTFAPNLVISGFACKEKLRIFQTSVLFTPRKTGEVSIKKWKLLKVSLKSFLQTISISFKI